LGDELPHEFAEAPFDRKIDTGRSAVPTAVTHLQPRRLTDVAG
jgi:hypothetical protein